jgi:V8-like Glu-specific endopeptidase
MSPSLRCRRAALVLFPLLALLVSLALVAPGALARPAPAGPGPAPAGPGPVDSGNTASTGASRLSAGARALMVGSGPAAEAQALEKYWTPERMRTALPADDLASPAGPAAGAGTGPAPAAGPAAGPPGKVEPVGRSVPGPRSSVPDLPPDHLVASTYGKVFFTRASDGLRYVCSATVVNSSRKDTVWTAGHCVHGGPGETWHRDWQFVPAYKDAAEPYGRWYADRFATRSAWANDGDFSEDLGAATLRPLDGVEIVDAVGAQGIAWNYPPGYHALGFGYPQDPPFDGRRLIACEGDTSLDRAGIIVLPCDMTGGSSGGGWLREADGRGLGYLNGLNSHGYGSRPGLMFSPYYGEAVRSLYHYVIDEV